MGRKPTYKEVRKNTYENKVKAVGTAGASVAVPSKWIGKKVIIKRVTRKRK